MSQSKINFSFCLSVKYGRLFVILFRRRYAKSHINFSLPFSNMFLRVDFSLYQIDSLPMSFLLVPTLSSTSILSCLWVGTNLMLALCILPISG